MLNQDLNRRSLLQLLAATMAGSAVLPFIVSSEPFGYLKDNCEKPCPVHILKGNGIKGKIAENEFVFKLNKEQTIGNLGSVETTLYPGYMGAVPHRHKNFDEVCRVLEGTLTILVGEEIYQVKAGDWHLRPRCIVHSFWNSGKVPVKFIELYIPGGHEKYMQELTTLFENGRTPKAEDIDEVAKKHDIEFFWEKLPALLNKYNVHL